MRVVCVRVHRGVWIRLRREEPIGVVRITDHLTPCIGTGGHVSEYVVGPFLDAAGGIDDAEEVAVRVVGIDGRVTPARR